MDFKQIKDKLNAEFTGASRKLVFWYDEKAEFVDDIENIEFINARLLKLEKDNSFYTKHFLEKVDTETNYLVYAPFAKPAIKNNHLADTIYYSKEFFGDKVSLIMVDLGIHESLKPVIQKYIKFFGAKDRTERFYDLQTEGYTEEIIDTAVMSSLCKARTVNFEEIARIVLTDGALDDNKYLTEFEKYEALPAFWLLCETHFGYADVKPTPEKLAITLLLTYTAYCIGGEIPKAWSPYISYKTGNVVAFVGNLMNNMLYRSKYNTLAAEIGAKINAGEQLAKLPLDSMLACDTFEGIDRLILDWVTTRLCEENLVATLDGKDIPAICKLRTQKHYGEEFSDQYKMLKIAFMIIGNVDYQAPASVQAIIKQYCRKDCAIDESYRSFYFYLDRLAETEPYEKLSELVENIYTNKFLAEITVKFNNALSGGDLQNIPKQQNFYSDFVQPFKERVVVIISDAFRYECANSLKQMLMGDEKCESAELEYCLSAIPSITKLGMAALLPHKTIEMDTALKVTVDGLPCDSLEQRQKILQKAAENSVCVVYDEISRMKREALRQALNNKDVIYIYHNQIDARGDKQNTENEVFTACTEAINELQRLVKKLTDDISATRFIITADHGFIYKREKLAESDKVTGNKYLANSAVNKRYIVTDQKVDIDGASTYSIDSLLGENTGNYVIVPKGADIFKISGGGQNYVHGGASPQEMILPVLSVRTAKGHQTTEPVKISLISMASKITNLVTFLDFMQVENVSDIVKATTYKVFFMAEDNERVSNENILVADKKNADPQSRTFRLKFTFKNKKYDKAKKHYLVVFDDKNDMELFRREFMMDIAFANDFGF